MDKEIIYPAAAKPEPKPMPRALLDQFLYQRVLLLERAGVAQERITVMPEHKAWNLFGDAMTKMAAALSKWEVDPGTVMEACFAYARSKKHADGPQLNMLGSQKYLLQAIAYYLEMPKAAADDMLSKKFLIDRLQKEADQHREAIARFMNLKYGDSSPDLLRDERRAQELSMFTSAPALHRFMYCATSIPLGRLLIPQCLEEIRTDARQRLWAQHCSWSYRGMAAYYRVIQPRRED